MGFSRKLGWHVLMPYRTPLPLNFHSPKASPTGLVASHHNVEQCERLILEETPNRS